MRRGDAPYPCSNCVGRPDRSDYRLSGRSRKPGRPLLPWSRKAIHVRINLKLFAVARQRAGSDSVSVLLPDPARVSDLRGALAEQVPSLAGLSTSLLIAIDSEYARDDTLIPPGSEVAAIPPVSGGSPVNREDPER